jgi:hypothetical protein
MSEMVDRVARALFAKEFPNEGDPLWTAETGGLGDREYWFGLARAAIEAMREPSEMMASFGGMVCYCADCQEAAGTVDSITAAATYRAMIDAALVEGG